eukprot:202825_1
MGFFSKSSPPGGRLNQGAEVRDLENQLRAPKPRPTATSWKNKPAIVIPVTIVCLILSCFILYAGVAYLVSDSKQHPEMQPPSPTMELPPKKFVLLQQAIAKQSTSHQPKPLVKPQLKPQQPTYPAASDGKKNSAQTQSNSRQPIFQKSDSQKPAEVQSNRQQSISTTSTVPHVVYFKKDIAELGQNLKNGFFFRIFGLQPGNKVSIPHYGSGKVVVADKTGVVTIPDKDEVFRHDFGKDDPPTILVTVNGTETNLKFLSPKIAHYTTKPNTSIKLTGLMPGFFAFVAVESAVRPAQWDKAKWEKMEDKEKEQLWYSQKVDPLGEVTFTTGHEIHRLNLQGRSVDLYYGDDDLEIIGKFTDDVNWEKVIQHPSELNPPKRKEKIVGLRGS